MPCRYLGVKGSPVQIRDSIARLSSETWSAGRSVWAADVGDRDLNVEVLEVRQGEPPEYVGLLLDLADDPDAQVVVRNRRYILDGKPVLLTVSYLPAKIAAGTPIEQPDPGPGGTYARLADLGYAPVRFREDLRSRMPEPEEAERVSLPPGTPVVEIVRTAYTDAGHMVEVNTMTADASAYIFRYDFSISSS